MEPKLEIGALYRVQFKSQSGNHRWYMREMTAVYLGFNQSKTERLFSLRPKAGTTALSIRWNPLEDWELLLSKDEVMGLRDGIRDKNLPVQLSRSLGPTEKPES
jgi:hypothetical protein